MKTAFLRGVGISALLLCSSYSYAVADSDPTSASIGGDGISVSGSGEAASRGNYAKSFRQSSSTSLKTTFTGTTLSKALDAIKLQPGRNTSDSTVPRIASDDAQSNGSGRRGGTLAGQGCMTNSGKGAAGRMTAIPLPVGETEGTGSFETDAVGNLACIPANAPAGEPVVVVDEVTGEKIEVEPIVISVSAEDFENQPIKPASLTMDNAPHSLKNYNTNIFAQSGEQTFTQNVMGEQVEIKAIPVSYTFNYGDGTVVTTTNPGHSVAEQWDVKTPTSHQYSTPGDYTYTVTTTFRGEFRVPGGPWQVIAGTSDRTSAPQTVQIWRVTSGNVEDSCVKNPSAYGCPTSKK
ncbi:hypothetical protein [Rothia amarae]|uniref:hypothetical protein n=1 Tax=Rothia amarae TaxID=169480 RepID=UPI0031D197AF